MNPYYWKYILGHLAQPLSLLVFLLLIATALLLWNKKTALAKGALVISVCGLYLLSTTWFADKLLRPLEFHYPVYQPQSGVEPDYIVVLGCAVEFSEHLPPSSHLQHCSQVRVHEALRLYRLHPQSQLIFTGSSWGRKPSIADAMAEYARRAGIPDSAILAISDAMDTSEEVAATYQRLKDKTTVLVTSAAHMRRSMYLYEQQGLALIPAPTDFLVRETQFTPALRHFIPEAKNLAKVDAAMHEYYGFIWLALLDLRD